MQQTSESDTAPKKKRGPKRRLTEKETGELVDLFNAGENAIDIATAFGISTPRVYQLLREAGTQGKRKRQIKGSEIYDVVVAQGFLCALSGRKLTMDNAEADHITPLARGGGHMIENIQILTAQVNRAKGTMTNEEFVALCCDVASHAGHRVAKWDGSLEPV